MKPFYKVLISVFVLFLASFVAISIFSSPSQFYDNNVAEFRPAHISYYTPEEKYVRPIGRTVMQDGIRWVSFSGGGIEFDCLAKYFNITIHSDTTIQTTNHKARLAVIANGDILFDETLTEDEQEIYIDLSDYSGAVTVKIIKLSESMYSAIGIGRIGIFEKRPIRPTTDKEMKIEFIGDSITAGYGIDEERQYAGFSTETENFSKTYAYLTAEELDAHYSTIAFSGYGVLSGATWGGRINSDATIFKYYDKAITNKRFEIEELTLWDSSKFEPDFVVINLGANDSTYCVTRERLIAFEAEYEKLLKLVREKNPNAYIVCVLGDLYNSVYNSIKNAVVTYKENSGDTKVTTSIIHYDMAKNGSVIDGHPTYASHIQASKDLIKVINSINQKGYYDENETESLNETEISETKSK